MTNYNVLATSIESTVVSEYIPEIQNDTAYQSEDALEKEFIKRLEIGGYEYLSIKEEKDLIENLRKQIENLNINSLGGLNGMPFSDDEWKRLFEDSIANKNDGIIEKTRIIQEDYIKTLKRDDGSFVNIKLIDKENVHNNKLQVINQYEVNNTKRKNRYDVTILVNGLPLVHTELKRRGVSIKEAFNQIDRYQRESFWSNCGLYEYIQIFIISNGTYTKYYSNTTRETSIKTKNGEVSKKTSNSFEFTSYWADQNNQPINDLIDFTKTFLSKHTLLNVLTKYCIFTTEQMLMVLRPYQIVAVEKIMNRVETSTNRKVFSKPEAGGYLFHTTGSGKTLSSFVSAQQLSNLEGVEKVIFVVDRKDLDSQTIREYEKFQKGAVNGNQSTNELQRQLEDKDKDGNYHQYKIIVTTIQKLGIFVKKNKNHPIYDKHVVIIFDECHRSQFGELHKNISKSFKKYHMFGFTGTPIYAKNKGKGSDITMQTTEQVFGDKLHAYTIVDAIRDNNVLPFSIDYVNSFRPKDSLKDKQVIEIDTTGIMDSNERIEKIVTYVLDNYYQKTKKDKSYTTKGKIMHGFNSLFACESIEMATKYYNEFKKQINERKAKDKSFDIKIATIFSYGANDSEETYDATGLEKSHRDSLEDAINDYNIMFKTTYDTSSDSKNGFYNYYLNLMDRIKNNEVDITIVVNMLLTGFDSPLTDVLWVDKNLEMHSLIQAFSRTNRILNEVKSYGKIVCFRNLKDKVEEALALYGDKDANGIVILHSYNEYLNGFTDIKGKYHKGYVELAEEIKTEFPLPIGVIASEEEMKTFVSLFSAILKARNILTSFDEFELVDGSIISFRDLQNYQSVYLQIREDMKKGRLVSSEKESILDDIEFEIELVEQVSVNIDYILKLIEKYHKDNCKDNEIINQIKQAINSSVVLRSKKELIEAFYMSKNIDVENIGDSWINFIKQRMKEELIQIIKDENLKEEETKRYINDCFHNGLIKTNGTGIDDLLPPLPRFGKKSSIRLEKKNIVLNKLSDFFEKFNNLIIELQID